MKKIKLFVEEKPKKKKIKKVNLVSSSKEKKRIKKLDLSIKLEKGYRYICPVCGYVEVFDMHCISYCDECCKAVMIPERVNNKRNKGLTREELRKVEEVVQKTMERCFPNSAYVKARRRYLNNT